MKKVVPDWPRLRTMLVATFVLSSAAARAEQDVTNRFSLSARFGFNISATFKGVTSLPAPSSSRTTPDGMTYNYDDGYILTDVSGNFGGQTWNWGYDDSARQVVGNSIQLNRTTGAASLSSPDLDSSPVTYGFELTYNRQLGVINDSLHYGIGAASNYLNFGLNETSSSSGSVTVVTDSYGFTPGTTPPSATPSSPYQGTFNGPGFLVGDTPISSVSSIIPGSALTDQRKFDANLWGLNIGPYLEIPLGRRFNLSLAAGVSLALLNSSASWTETVAIPTVGITSASGNGNDNAFLWGGFVGANASWEFYDHWTAVGGVQYQNLGKYQHSFGGREVEMDLRNSIFVTVGVGYSF